MTSIINFLVITNSFRSTSKKNIKSLTGGKERIDVLSRCLLNLSRWRDRIENHLQLIVYLAHPKEKKVIYIKLDSIESDIRSEIDSLSFFYELVTNKNHETDLKLSFRELIESISKENKLFYLTSVGKPFESYYDSFKQENICFILGSQNDLSLDQENILEEFKSETLSLGKKEYLASHVITIICNEIFIKEID